MRSCIHDHKNRRMKIKEIFRFGEILIISAPACISEASCFCLCSKKFGDKRNGFITNSFERLHCEEDDLGRTKCGNHR